jgi:hypothetical protein
VNAAEVVAAVLDALAPVTDQLPDGRWQDTADDERLTVRSTGHVAGCPAAAALDGDTPFETSPVLAGPAAAGAVLDRLLLGDADPMRVDRPKDPATAFREVYKQEPDDWAWRWAREEATPAERALLSAAVARRVAGAARMLQPWPPSEATQAGRRSPWSHPSKPLRLAGAADVTLGKRDGTHTLVAVLTGDHTGATRDRLAFEAVVEVLLRRRAPAAVRAVLADAGRDWSAAVDDALLTTGIEVIATAARTALGVQRRDATGLARRPGPACRRCAHAAGCTEGDTWLNGPGRLRLGFLPELPRPSGSD